MIKIKKNTKCDTRTCNVNEVSRDELLDNSILHIEDVRKGCNFFADKLKEAGEVHDTTKISKIDEFFKDFKTGFKTTDWWEMHQKEERHHFKNKDFIQEDVNLIDILEQITDGVMAGLARSGEYRKEELPEGLLQKAYDNTVKMLLKQVKVEE